jgi:hypothetical protein
MIMAAGHAPDQSKNQSYAKPVGLWVRGAIERRIAVHRTTEQRVDRHYTGRSRDPDPSLESRSYDSSALL